MENATAQLLAKWKEYKTAAFDSVRKNRNGVIINFSAFMDWLEAHQDTQETKSTVLADIEEMVKTVEPDIRDAEIFQEVNMFKRGARSVVKQILEFIDRYKSGEKAHQEATNYYPPDYQEKITTTENMVKQARKEAIDEAIGLVEKVLDIPWGIRVKLEALKK